MSKVHIIKKSPSCNLRLAITLSYLFLIYSTLAIVRPIAEMLRSSGFLIPTISVLFALFTLMTLGWRYATTPRNTMICRVFLLVALLAVALGLSGLPEERVHFITYGLAGWLICWCIEARPKKPLITKNGWLIACLLVWLAGGVDELIQWWLPVRVFDVRDIMFNGVAGMMGVALFSTGCRRDKVS